MECNQKGVAKDSLPMEVPHVQPRRVARWVELLNKGEQIGLKVSKEEWLRVVNLKAKPLI